MELSLCTNYNFLIPISISEAEFKEFEPKLKFQTRLKYGWFHLNNKSLKYQRFTQSCCEDIGIRKIKFVAETHIPSYFKKWYGLCDD